MMDLIYDYILFDCVDNLSGNTIFCDECDIGVLREYEGHSYICDVCDVQITITVDQNAP